MKNLLRKWLGLNVLQGQITQLQEGLTKLQAEFAAAVYDEHDPRRKEASNKLGAIAVNRMLANQKVRDHYGY